MVRCGERVTRSVVVEQVVVLTVLVMHASSS
jgi:hypothetical protein